MEAGIHEEREEDIWLGGRSARLTPNQKTRIRAYCIKRDGYRCMICNREEPNDENLEIDHINGNASDHRASASNLRLVHHRCNAKEYHRRMSGHSERENTRQAYLQPYSPEIRLNRQYEPNFRRYCFARVKEAINKGEYITKEQLRIEAREIVGCSGPTSYSYMERLFAPNGPLMEDVDLYSNTRYVKFRDPKDINFSIDELAKKYPKEGRMYAEDVDLK